MEMLEGRGCGPEGDHIHLKLFHLPSEVLRTRLPGILETAKVFAGVDGTKESIPVSPTVHYNMGGIPTNWKAQVLTVDEQGNDKIVPGLLAAGEAASASVHGANRLGANSLLDIVVFGKMSSLTIKDLVKPNSPHPNYSAELGRNAIEKVDKIRYSKGELSAAKIRTTLQKAMQSHAAVFRIEDSMQKGVEKVNEAMSMYSHLGITDRVIIYFLFF